MAERYRNEYAAEIAKRNQDNPTYKKFLNTFYRTLLYQDLDQKCW